MVQSWCTKKRSRLWYRFFFSSRRRHTRCLSDWSSDVCSSDLKAIKLIQENVHRLLEALAQRQAHAAENRFLRHGQYWARVAANSGHKIVHRLLELKIGRASCRERV